MNRFGAVVVASLTSMVTAHAAEVSRIATAGEEKTPFSMFIDVDYQHWQELGTLARTWHANGTLASLPELRYRDTVETLGLDAHIGLFHDLELHYGVPVILSNVESWDLSSSTTKATSTITQNCLNADGTLTNPACPTTGQGAVPLFGVPQKAYRQGLGNMTFGLAWAPFNQDKDDTKPTWILGFDYTAPTAKLLDPSIRTTSGSHGAVGDREHHYTFFTTLARDYGVAEPYFKLWYSFPFQAWGYDSNCDHPNPANMAAPGNCGVGPWTHAETGIHEPQTGGFFFGTELHAYEAADKSASIGLDLRAIGNYVGPGRYYDEMSYLLGKLLYAEDYLQVGGSLGLVAKASSWLLFTVHGSVLYDTNHTVTAEQTGKDLTGAGFVNLTPGSPDVNPNFDYRVDAPGRQFRLTNAFVFALDAKVSVTF